MPKPSKKYPKRGYIYTADLNPGFGREIRKKRPVLIISNDISNESTPYVVAIPTSSVIPDVISEGMVYLGKIRGLDKESVLLTIFIRSIDKVRLIKRIGKLSTNKMYEVEESLRFVLDITETN